MCKVQGNALFHNTIPSIWIEGKNKESSDLQGPPYVFIPYIFSPTDYKRLDLAIEIGVFGVLGIGN